MKKHIFDKTKIKALLLSGVTLLSGVSCGKTNTQKEQPQSAILMETETTKNNNTVTTTEKNAKQESTSNNYNNTNDNYTEYENTNTQEEQMAPTEGHTEGHTEAHTEAHTEGHTEEKKDSKTVLDQIILPSIGGHKVKSEQPQTSNNSSERTTRIVTNITTKKTTQPTTKKTTQTTTKTTTRTTTTTKPVTQAPTQPATQPPKTDYNKYDLVNPNPEIAARAFEKLSSELRKEMYDNYLVTGAWGVSNGADQARTILAALNYDQGISPEVLASDEALGRYTQEELIQNCEALDFGGNGYNRIDLNKYMLNEDLANYLEDLIGKFDEWYNGNGDPLFQELQQYQVRYDLKEPEPGENSIKTYMYTEMYYYTIGMSHDKAKQILANNVIIPMYQNFEQYKGHSYTR